MKQVFMSGLGAASPTDTTNARQDRVFSSREQALASNDTQAGSDLVPYAGTIRNLFIKVVTAITQGSYDFEIYKNGSSTGYKATLTPGETTATATGSLSLAKKDEVKLVITPTGSPEAVEFYKSFDFEDDAQDADRFFLSSSGGGALLPNITAKTEPFAASNGYTTAANAIAASFIMPFDATLNEFYVKADSSITTNFYQIYVTKNGTRISNILTLNSSFSSAEQTGASLSVSKGDLISVEYTSPASTTSVNKWKMALVFTADADGKHYLAGATDSANQTMDNNEYIQLGRAGYLPNTSESAHTVTGAIEPGILSNFIIETYEAPGTGNSITYTVQKNSSDTSLSVTLSGAETSGETVADVAVTSEDVLTVKVTTTGTPSVKNAAYACTLTLGTLSGSGGAVASPDSNLSQAELEWLRSRVPELSSAPIGQIKRVYYMQQVGRTTGTTNELELDWIRTVISNNGGMPVGNRLTDLWKQMMAQLGLPVFNNLSQMKLVFYKTATV